MPAVPDPVTDDASDATHDEPDDTVVEPFDPDAGASLVTASWVATGIFTAAATVATVFPDQLARPVAVFDCLLFVAGLVAFGVAFARAVNRSRTERIEIAALFFLAGATAPTSVKRNLLGSFTVQIVVAMVTSSIRLYTSVAFGILVPMLGLGLAGVWGATHGRFPPRDR